MGKWLRTTALSSLLLTNSSCLLRSSLAQKRGAHLSRGTSEDSLGRASKLKPGRRKDHYKLRKENVEVRTEDHVFREGIGGYDTYR